MVLFYSIVIWIALICIKVRAWKSRKCKYDDRGILDYLLGWKVFCKNEWKFQKDLCSMRDERECKTCKLYEKLSKD